MTDTRRKNAVTMTFAPRSDGPAWRTSVVRRTAAHPKGSSTCCVTNGRTTRARRQRVSRGARTHCVRTVRLALRTRQGGRRRRCRGPLQRRPPPRHPRVIRRTRHLHTQAHRPYRLSPLRAPNGGRGRGSARRLRRRFQRLSLQHHRAAELVLLAHSRRHRVSRAVPATGRARPISRSAAFTSRLGVSNRLE